jgi:hypothetical protein
LPDRDAGGAALLVDLARAYRFEVLQDRSQRSGLRAGWKRFLLGRSICPCCAS